MGSTETRIIVNAKDKATKTFRRIRTQVEGFRRSIMSMNGALATIGAGVGFVEFYKHVEGYDTALHDMVKVTDESMSSINAKMLGMDNRLGSNTDLVRGYYQTISSGVTEPIKAQDLLTRASKSAQAGHVEQGEVIKALTKYMAGFGTEVRDAADAADSLFTIERIGQTSFKELVPVVGDLANASHELGVSQEEMGASMALLTQTSGTTAEAATKYKAVLVSLLKPQERMRALLEGGGFSSGQELLSKKGLLGALRWLRDEAEASGLQLGQLMESQEAMLGVFALLSKAGIPFNKNLEAMKNRAGAAEKAFQNWTKSMESFRKEMLGAIDDVALALGDELKPTLRDTMQGISDWTKENKDLVVDGIEGITLAVKGLAAALLYAGSGWKNIAGMIELARADRARVNSESRAVETGRIVDKLLAGEELNRRELAMIQEFQRNQLEFRQQVQKIFVGGPTIADVERAWTARQENEIILDDSLSRAGKSSGKSKAAASAEDVAKAIEQVRDKMAKLTMSQIELERRDFSKEVDKWTASLGAANPELQALIDKQTRLFDLQEKFSLQPYQVTELSGVSDGWLARDRGKAEADQRGEQMLQERMDHDLQLQVEFAEQFRQIMIGETEFKKAQLDAQAEAYRQAGADEVAVAKWVEQERLRLSRDASDGIRLALEEWADSATNAAEQMGGFLTTNLDSATSNLSDQLIDGEADWDNWGRTALKQLTAISLQLSVMGPLAKALSGSSLSEAGGVFSFLHGGAIVGAEPGAFARALPLSTFVGAPRYHSGKLPGLAPDEVAAVLKKNEAVFTPEQLDALGRAVATGRGGGTTRVQVDVGEGLVAHIVNDPQFEKQILTTLKHNPEAVGRS